MLSRASQIYFLQGQYEKALQLADLGLQFDAQDADCLVNKGAALIELNRLSDANEVFDAALRTAPESYLVHLNVGALRLRQGNQPGAFEHYRESLRLNATSEKARAGVVESLKAKNPVYHLLLKFSIWCRKLPKPAIAALVILILIPVTRYVIVLLLVLFGIADRAFELSLKLDPNSRDFIKPPVEHSKFEKILLHPGLVVGIVVIGIVIAVSSDLNKTSHHEPPVPTTFKDYKAYMNYVQKRIEHNWYPQHLQKSNKAIVEFEVNRDGSVKRIKIIESSGDKYSDQAAIQAVKWATPLPALPASTKDPSVTVHFDFQYNVAAK